MRPYRKGGINEGNEEGSKKKMRHDSQERTDIKKCKCNVKFARVVMSVTAAADNSRCLPVEFNVQLPARCSYCVSVEATPSVRPTPLHVTTAFTYTPSRCYMPEDTNIRIQPSIQIY